MKNYNQFSSKRSTSKVLDLSKKEIIIKRLEAKLARPKEEVNKLISHELMSLLLKVPFNRYVVL